MSEHPLELSLAEKLDLIPAFPSISEPHQPYHVSSFISIDHETVLAASIAAVEWPFRRTNRADTFYHHVIHAIVRKVCMDYGSIHSLPAFLC